MKKSVSLKDIANQLGVSASLVSYVLNGHAKKKRVSDEIAKKVLATAEKLSYQPNQIAKSLKTKKSQTIGLIVQELHYRYTTVIARAVETQAHKSSYTVIIGNSHEDLSMLKELIHVLINRQVDGLIIVASEGAEAEIEYIKKREIPFVLVDRNFPSVETNYIGINNYQVAYDAVTYLLDRGFRHIGFLNYQTSFFHLRERTRGYREALSDRRIKIRPSLLREIKKKSLASDIQKAVSDLTSGKTDCDAIFFATDTLAVTGLKNIVRQNKKVPKDIAVLSFDDSEAFALFECPITHFKQPIEEIGKMAVDLLFEVMDGKAGYKQVYLDSSFIKGKSCGEEG